MAAVVWRRVRFAQRDVWEGFTAEHEHDTIDVEVYDAWLDPATELVSRWMHLHLSGLLLGELDPVSTTPGWTPPLSR